MITTNTDIVSAVRSKERF